MPRSLSLLLATALVLCACNLPTTTSKPATQPTGEPTVLLDFEQPDPPVTWIPDAAATAPAPSTIPAASQGEFQPAPNPLQRTSHRPHAGLWSLGTALTQPGEIRFTPPKPLDLSSRDVLTAQVTHADVPGHNGYATAALVLTDADGTTVQGDAFPILSTWQPITFDLQLASDRGLDTARISSIALALHPTRELAADTPLAVQTDTWATQDNRRAYLGSSPASDFYVVSRGTRLAVDMRVGCHMTLFDRGANTPTPNWLDIHTLPPPSMHRPSQKALGQTATGLFLLDQSGLDALGALRRQDADSAPVPLPPPVGRIPDTPWPFSLNPALHMIHWSVVWTSPVAALVEGTEESGPYDRLGLPAVTIKWQLMIYQWGQVFVHARWSKSPELAVPDPITWALVTEDARLLEPEPPPADRLLADIYTPRFRENLRTALPHEMQATAPVAMIARTTPQKDTFWRAAGTTAEGLRRHVFGAALPPPAGAGDGQVREADCMLLVNNPDALTKATCFSQYLDPPFLAFRQGELDTTNPGDIDHDGFVESYGFQEIRLSNGRAVFTINPRQRPIFYPPILFTIPAVERDALDVKHSKLLINIDGKQFTNPPMFTSDSFLLQVPYQLDGERPVSVEALLVK